MIMFLIAPTIGVLSALAAVVAEQLLAVLANIFFQTEITSVVYANLSFFLIAAAIIEESLKYLSAAYVLRKIYALKKFRFIFASIIVGLFFGLTEIYFVLLANGKDIRQIPSLDGGTLFSLAGVLLLHVLTIFLMAVLIAKRREAASFGWLRTASFPIFVHLLFNFLVIQRSDFTNWLIGLVLAIAFVTAAATFASNSGKLD